MSRYFSDGGNAARTRLTNTRIIASDLFSLRQQVDSAFNGVQYDVDSTAGPSVFNFQAGATWVVNHNRGRAVTVDVLSVGGARIGAEVQHVSSNQLRVHFDVPVPGRVVVY